MVYSARSSTGQTFVCMDSRRLAYLKALDIDVWERRDRDFVAASAASIATAEPLSLDAGAAEPVVQPAANSQTYADEVAALAWPELEARVAACTRCELHRTRTHPVFGVGDRTAQWMIIGEAPGADEDRQGEPFVGRAGQLLNSMLKAVGLGREQVFIANILKSRPPHNRDPSAAEVAACIPYLYRQIELVNPRLILCVGRIAAQTLLETDLTIGKLRGKVHQLANGRPMIVTYHPAYLLRSPGEKRKVWADLVLAMQTFDQLATAGARA